MSKVISITSSKGGSGKTTLTAIAGALFMNEHKKRVALIDVDPQKSLLKKRESEIKLIKGKDVQYTKQVLKNKDDLNMYFSEVIYIDLKADFNTINAKINKVLDHFDYVFVDFPGSLLINDNALRLLKLIDYIFIPLYVDKNSYDSTIEFYKSLADLKEKNEIKGKSYLFFNKYSKRKNTSIFNSVKVFFEKRNIPLLKSVIYNYVSLEDYSTVLSPKIRTKDFKPEYEWVNEIIKIIK